MGDHAADEVHMLQTLLATVCADGNRLYRIYIVCRSGAVSCLRMGHSLIMRC